jgi:tryptophan-rich sensory protein
MSKLKQIVGILGWLVTAFAAAGIGSVASIDAGVFYSNLNQPGWAPPPSVFGPVWTVLYTLMGVAAWLIWRDGGFRVHRAALCLFFIQLVANALWSWLFFAWRLGGWAFVDIMALWALLGATIGTFWRVRPVAGALLIPYLIWVTFAAFLNYSLWRINPGLLR